MSPRVLPQNVVSTAVDAPSKVDSCPALLRRAVLKTLAAAGAVAILPTIATGAPTRSSIAIKFAGQETNGAGGDSMVTGPAGVLNTVNWNNTTGQSGGPTAVSMDRNNAFVVTPATVTWSSNVGTWSSSGRGEENNFASGENRDLMAGYLDTDAGPNGITLSMSGLNFVNSPFSLGYDVYVYIQGGVNGRGGTYTLGSTVFYHEVTAAFDGTFIEDTTLDTPTGPEGSFGSNYLVFRNVQGDSFSVTTVPTVGGTRRAPINAIEVVAKIPEPAAFTALVFGSATLLGLRRSRRH